MSERAVADGRLFDVYVAVDWSARSVPSPARPVADALWVGEAAAPGVDSAPPGETYWRTRAACVAHLRARLVEHVGAGRRVFLGGDFAYDYPAGFAAALGLRGLAPPWRQTWDELSRLIVDDPANGNNRFAVAAALNARCGGPAPGPFWACPRGQAWPGLESTSPAYPYPVAAGRALERLRHVDRAVHGVQPVWKLVGTGSVGGQTLLGIPAVAGLRADPALAAVSRVWPFETGFIATPTAAHGPFVLHAEIWPGIVPEPLDPACPIRDQAQVRAVVRWLAALDAAGQLGPLFAAPPDLAPAALGACLAEEGWMVGAGTVPRSRLHRRTRP